ncbi:MAG: flagellin [Clostridia bacterium]|nr:flagellin [Clostridia bacterium]
MGLSVQTDVSAMNIVRNMKIHENNMNSNLEQLSSGYKINSAADDAAGLAISEKLKGQLTGLEQAELNVQDAVSLLQTAEGGMNTVHNILNRMVELTTKASNGIYDSTVDREAIQSELNSLNEEINRISNSVNFNNKKLLDGSFNSIQFQIGSEESDTLFVTIGSINIKALGLDAIDVSSPEKALESLQIVKDAINSVSKERANVGVTQNRLEYTLSNLEETYANLSEANSRIRDVDYAKVMMEYTKNQLLHQVSVTMLSHRMSNAQNILQLFR